MPILGLRGTGSFSADERPKNWREAILYMYANGEAPLTALLSKMRNEPTNDPEFNYWEKGLPSQRTQINNGAGYASGATSLVVDDATMFRKTHAVLVERTNEILIVTADPVNATTVVVARGKGEVAAAALLDDDWLFIIGTINEEGGKSGNPVSYSAVKQFNYTQIFKTPLFITRTARKTRLRTDRTGPYREAKREALQLHALEMEKAFIFGQRLEEIGPDGQLRRATRGFRRWISTNIITDANADGVWTDADFTNMLELMFRHGSSEKLALVGSLAAATVSTWARKNGTINMVPGNDVYGMKIAHLIGPAGGDLYMKIHPLMSDHPVYRKDMMIVDLDKLVYRYIDDTVFDKDIGDRDQDASKDQYLTEAGLELNFEKAHGLITNLASYSG